VASLGLAKALTDKGVKITFVLPNKADLNINFLNLVFADLKKVQGTYTTSSKSSRLGFANDYITAAYQFGERVREVAAKHGSDIIHSHDWLTFPAGLAAREVTGKPLVTHVHSTEFDRTGGHYPNPEVYEIEKKGLQRSDKIISVSQFTKNLLVENYGINPDKVSVIHNAVTDPGKKDVAPGLTSFKKLGYKIVLYLGRITLQKGPEYFIRAAKKVVEYESKVVFVVAGSGDMQEQMIKEAAGLGILGNVLFTGFLRGEEIDRIYQAADLYVMPSVSEPFGITSLEAVINGTPVIVSKQSGVSEVLTNVLKVDFWDIDEMANKILSVVKYDPLQKCLAQNAMVDIKDCTWDKAAEKCLQVYESLINH